MAAPSGWVLRWSRLIKAQSRVLDVACGSGRHLQLFQDLGHRVYGVDRDIEAAQQSVPQAQLTQADIEQGPWPYRVSGALDPFDAIIVTNYLWRPLLSTLLASLAPGGVLIYETFTRGNETVGRPARPDFLLAEGELLEVCAGLHIVGYENGFLTDPDRFVQRVAAVKPVLSSGANHPPARYAL